MTEVSSDVNETLDIADRVVQLEFGFDHLVVITPSQCHIYSITNWNTPAIFDLKNGSVSAVLLADKYDLFYQLIVYYAPREEKTWTVHISCKLPPERPEPKARVANTRCGLANFTPVERILFFLTPRPKMTYFRFCAGREWGTFGPV